MLLLAFAAALRKDSFNRKLLRLAVTSAEKAGATVDHADFHEFDMPLYDGDVEAATGIPPGAQKLRERFLAADAFMIASPEYNFSIPGTLKNAIDWVTRANPIAWRGKPGLLMSASPSLAGGNRGLWVTRVSLEVTGAILYPDMFSLASAHEAFDDKGLLKDAKMAARLDKNVAAFLKLAQVIATSTPGA
jgi:chromate reductase, NAD(P)H dehydrogenase (quinone)